MLTDLTNIKAILLDIEGTTTPISFVYETLFPFAQREIRQFLSQHSEDAAVRDAVAELENHRATESQFANELPAACLGSDLSGIAEYARWLMSRDSKLSALKTLQGMIWLEGYEQGALRGILFDDVPPALRRWQSRGLSVYIYSSGSVLAQKLIFGKSNHGDLRGLLNGYFDTSVGKKTDAGSYGMIARETGVQPNEFLFISDAPQELEAANAAGFRTLHSARPGNPQTSSRFEVIHSFAEISL